MLSIEEYIAKRKKEDKLNEFNLDNRIDNIRICTNYIFEYFDKYLDVTKIDQKTILNSERLNKYRKQLKEYEEDVQEWLVAFYDEHGKYMHKIIGNILEEEEIFLLYSEDSEFRSISYECYSKLIKKHPFLREQTEMMFLFIKDYHRVKSSQCVQYNSLPFFTEKISKWIEKTESKYNVSIPAFAVTYINKFYHSIDRWPATHKKKSDNQYILYDYDYKQKKNLFNIDSLYTKISKKSFIKGHKQDLELIMMYYWLHDIETDDNYWDEYISKVIPK
ncbi:hypothetical protein [Tissierella sp.]|uniref:hypothetical protein n=1 Tax=Tissierella sp. TaxID=41274 RepID=UPI003059317D